ncbi:MAG TPA: MAPEG family protein [Bdellovibrionota bacterium]|jgi:uncharacterized MAPEG superfamily protein|nr:MAPEG family protein [Bdellovibrionota bacterium]
MKWTVQSGVSFREIECLLAMVAWTLGLVGIVAVSRSTWVLVGKKRASGFPSGQEHGPEWYQRINRMHANAVENLAPFAALVLIGQIVARAEPLFERACVIFIASRIVQGLAHAISAKSDLVVTVRFTFFIIQYFCMIGLLIAILWAHLAVI